MKFKINRDLFPIKAHFFFFFAALGPILPQLNVFGRQLGVSPGAMGVVTSVLPVLWALAKPMFGYVVDYFPLGVSPGAMGVVTSVLPVLWALAKPMVGYVVDYFPTHRKLVFMLLITIMTGSYCCLYFLPMPQPTELITQHIYKLNNTIKVKELSKMANTTIDKYHCLWNCSQESFSVHLANNSFIDTVYVEDVRNTSCSLLYMEFESAGDGWVVCVPKEDCDLMCYEEGLRNKRDVNESTGNYTYASQDGVTGTDEERSGSFYMTATFWVFVVLMCVGTVAFNVANCIGDAVCFDVLGPERSSKYGNQRAWGTVGYGATALAGGCLIDLYSGASKDFTPAFVIALVATAADLYSCRRLTLPPLSSPEDSGRALRKVLRIPRVLVFISFAVVAGAFDSFIIYYMFWFLEELAEETGQMARIKLIEGVVVAAQSFVGELLFFFLSGKIIKRWGYGTTLTASLLCYGLRMALISLIQHPWHLVFIEGIMQGPTYALCYSTIVGYAAHVAPEGYSATVQGIVAGMDDGLGFAVGSLLGGQLYATLGGRRSFRVFAGVAVAGSMLHAALFALTTRNDGKKQVTKAQEEREGQKMLEEHSDAIYRDTVQPITEGTKN